jgi:hypothetical protein
MPPSDRARTFDSAPIDELLSILLRQLKRPLAAHGFSIADAEQLARECVSAQPIPRAPELIVALRAVVKESQRVLEAIGLTFEQSMRVGMEAVKGWETTAEFLDLANEKSNAELRITLASGLGLVFGLERAFAPDLLFLAKGDYGDESVIARRCLAFAARVDHRAPDALKQIEDWLRTPG